MSRAWMVGTPLPEALAAEAHAVVDHLRSDGPRRDRADRTAALILALADESLRYHFREPLDALGVGMVARKTVGVALDLVLRGLKSPIRSVLGGMDDAQLAGVADAIEQRLYPDPHG